MLRFIPDSWLEWLLRPLLLADSVAGLYVEIQAPDWRFAALLLLLTIALLAQRHRTPLEGAQWRALIGLGLAFYVWTFASGNGRYFLWGLLLVGPLVVAVARSLPATTAMRNTVILGVLALQGFSAWMTFEANTWGLRPWREGPGLALAKTPLTDRPAVFFTIGSISYSILVPQFHPRSRWSNITGQTDWLPGSIEYKHLTALLDSPLPKYVVIRATRLVMGDDRQPIAQAREIIDRVLAQKSLRPADRPCEFVQTNIAGLPYRLQKAEPVDGFWFCEVATSAGAPETRAAAPFAPELDDVFARIEQRCPRFFPPGNARSRPGDGAVVRHYSHSDTSVSVNTAGAVYFKNMRALNPTVIGEVEQVRRGTFTLDCDRLPGHYTPPWERD